METQGLAWRYEVEAMADNCRHTSDGGICPIPAVLEYEWQRAGHYHRQAVARSDPEWWARQAEQFFSTRAR